MKKIYLIKNKSRGFTLIELLVVVAIMGVLASIVLASLNSAREKGKEAGIKSNLISARNQAEIFYLNNTINPQSYLGVCTNGTYGDTEGIGKFILESAKIVDLNEYNIYDDINGWTPEAPDDGLASCYDLENSWVVEIPTTLEEDYLGEFYCIDHTGTFRKSGVSIANMVEGGVILTVCPP